VAAPANLSPPSSLSRPQPARAGRLAGRPRGLSDSQCRELMLLHIRHGMTPAQLAPRYNLKEETLRHCLSQPFLRAIGDAIVERGDTLLASMMLVMKSATLRAAENIAAAVDRGDLSQSQFVLNWHSRLMPQQVEVSGHIHHQHDAHAALAVGVGKLSELLATHKPRSMDGFVIPGTANVADDMPPRLAAEAGGVEFTPDLEHTAPPTPKVVEVPAPARGTLQRQPDGSFLLGS
jgi:hypothetical protein